MRDGAVEAMAKAIDGTFEYGTESEWTPEATAALDALLDYLEANADEWERTALDVSTKWGIEDIDTDDLVAVLREVSG
jgi:hypothetical protein